MIAVGPHTTLRAGQSLAHGQELDGNAHAVFVQAAGRHALEVSGEDETAIGLVHRQRTHLIVSLAQVGLILLVSAGARHIPVHRQTRSWRVGLSGHDIDQAHHVAVTRMTHQHGAICGGSVAGEDRRAGRCPRKYQARHGEQQREKQELFHESNYQVDRLGGAGSGHIGSPGEVRRQTERADVIGFELRATPIVTPGNAWQDR